VAYYPHKQELTACDTLPCRYSLRHSFPVAAQRKQLQCAQQLIKGQADAAPTETPACISRIRHHTLEELVRHVFPPIEKGMRRHNRVVRFPLSNVKCICAQLEAKIMRCLAVFHNRFQYGAARIAVYLISQPRQSHEPRRPRHST
jgi:hypothetical protein